MGTCFLFSFLHNLNVNQHLKVEAVDVLDFYSNDLGARGVPYRFFPFLHIGYPYYIEWDIGYCEIGLAYDRVQRKGEVN